MQLTEYNMNEASQFVSDVLGFNGEDHNGYPTKGSMTFEIELPLHLGYGEAKIKTIENGEKKVVVIKSTGPTVQVTNKYRGVQNWKWESGEQSSEAGQLLTRVMNEFLNA